MSCLYSRTWRGSKHYYTDEIEDLGVGEAQQKLIQSKLLDRMEILIKETFDYPAVEILEKSVSSEHKNEQWHGQLQPFNDFSQYSFGITMIDQNKSYDVSIKKIPCRSENKYIEIFFQSIAYYIANIYCEIIRQNSSPKGENITANKELAIIADNLLYNLDRAIIIEYLYKVLNLCNEQYEERQELIEPPIRYDIDLLENILALAYELSCRKIENEEINIGFIFHNNVEELINNSVRAIKLKNEIKFGDFLSIKNVIPISNGQNIFFNVTNGIITHILITKHKLKEIYFQTMRDGKNFIGRPLIVSIQGPGKILFIEGGLQQNNLLLEITNGKLKIRDFNFVRNHLLSRLRKEINIDIVKLERFIDWILSLAYQKHGTSILIGNFKLPIENKLVKFTPVECPIDFLLSENDENGRYDLELLSNIIKPDGAILFGKDLRLHYISTILPFAKTSGTSSGGARHNSVKNFTSSNKCFGIVVSEDGPITLFKNGKIIIAF